MLEPISVQAKFHLDASAAKPGNYLVTNPTAPANLTAVADLEPKFAFLITLGVETGCISETVKESKACARVMPAGGAITKNAKTIDNKYRGVRAQAGGSDVADVLSTVGLHVAGQPLPV